MRLRRRTIRFWTRWWLVCPRLRLLGRVTRLDGRSPVILCRCLRIRTFISRGRFGRTIVRRGPILVWAIHLGPICFRAIRLRPILIRTICLAPLRLRVGSIRRWIGLRTFVSRGLLGWPIILRRPVIGRVGTLVRGLIVFRTIVLRAIVPWTIVPRRIVPWRIARTVIGSIGGRFIAGPVPCTRTFVRSWIIRSRVIGSRIVVPRIILPISRPIRRARARFGYRTRGPACGRLPDLRTRHLGIRGSRFFHLPHLLPGNRSSRIRGQRLLPRRKRNGSGWRSRSGNDRAPGNCCWRRFHAIRCLEAGTQHAV